MTKPLTEYPHVARWRTPTLSPAKPWPPSSNEYEVVLFEDHQAILAGVVAELEACHILLSALNAHLQAFSTRTDTPESVAAKALFANSLNKLFTTAVCQACGHVEPHDSQIRNGEKILCSRAGCGCTTDSRTVDVIATTLRKKKRR